MKKKKIAVVTEAGNDLGKKFAQILTKNGYEVILAAKKSSYVALSREAIPAGIHLVKVDFTSIDSLIVLKNFIQKGYGKLDLLVNNAEIANGFGQKIDTLNMTEVKQLYEENFFSIIRVIQVLQPLIQKSERPNIINITNPIGDIAKMQDERFPYANYQMTAYATAKAALNMYTVLQAKEFENSKINIHSFDPIKLKNCTHNSVTICKTVEKEFLSLTEKDEKKMERC
ncbi:SDR family NAD(P)-dependent oxidoreductase [Aquimarina gracilis]|uniref:SDR family NAD(P)-dependent oxidoreductase n=1 Tax=Aquimarina gracilis TaxID=874422 RepID=A0ABU5ZS57_9FLAO|nr:SDR family NAD(P)-dependent oxidoreductase [Aquimarina gracilis]MEB3344768.1 SDR family NAD(P)-dependent oxidoreductase [Aquimarina gracilis]